LQFGEIYGINAKYRTQRQIFKLPDKVVAPASLKRSRTTEEESGFSKREGAKASVPSSE
jgi:hypothetical protein